MENNDGGPGIKSYHRMGKCTKCGNHSRSHAHEVECLGGKRERDHSLKIHAMIAEDEAFNKKG